jgi:alkylation response protein AidB-like acyl-CoA dehydrogenase
MDLRLTAEDVAFRDEVREFIRTHLPPDIARKAIFGQRFGRDDVVRWTRILHERGWSAPSWPAEWGGPGWDPVKQHIFRDEIWMSPAPELLGFNVNMIGPTLIAFGSEAQKRHFLPRIQRLDYWFCQGFSEPGSGSDLASLRTRAVRDGDHYVINGQKIWTTQAQHADWCFLLVRTDPEVKPQRGITYLLMDMATPGITVRPIHLIDGHHELNEIFLEDVRVPVANRVGEENRGWDYAKYLLSHERTGVARTGLNRMRLELAKSLAKDIRAGGRPLSEDAAFRERVASLEIAWKALEMTVMRVLVERASLAGGQADPKSSILKIRGSELQQATTELLVELAGYAAMEYDHEFIGGARPAERPDDWTLSAAANQYWLRHTSISAGTNEIQRNVLAKAVLGL